MEDAVGVKKCRKNQGLAAWWNGRHWGLKIPWGVTPVPVRVRPRPLGKCCVFLGFFVVSIISRRNHFRLTLSLKISRNSRLWAKEWAKGNRWGKLPIRAFPVRSRGGQGLPLGIRREKIGQGIDGSGEIM